MLTRFWLSPVVLDWPASTDENWSYRWEPGAELSRPYRLLEHAEYLVSGTSSAEQRSDCVVNLNKTIRLRLEALERTYRLKSVPVRPRPRRLLELLALFGLIRPLMLEELISIRNAVEHDDADPPIGEECIRLVEFTWYFLRSTDPFLKRFAGSYQLRVEYPDLPIQPYSLDVRVDLDDSWVPICEGCVPGELVSTERKTGWLELHSDAAPLPRDDVIERQMNFIGRDPPKTRDPRALAVFKAGYFPTDLNIFRGQLRGPREALIRVLRRFFR